MFALRRFQIRKCKITNTSPKLFSTGMANVFAPNDPLLGSIGTVVVYYIAFRNAAFAGAATREKLEDFENWRRAAARMAEDSSDYYRGAFARLREYNAFVQSTNDGRALQRRADILTAFVVPHSATTVSLNWTNFPTVICQIRTRPRDFQTRRPLGITLIISSQFG